MVTAENGCCIGPWPVLKLLWGSQGVPFPDVFVAWQNKLQVMSSARLSHMRKVFKWEKSGGTLMCLHSCEIETLATIEKAALRMVAKGCGILFQADFCYFVKFGFLGPFPSSAICKYCADCNRQWQSELSLVWSSLSLFNHVKPCQTNQSLSVHPPLEHGARNNKNFKYHSHGPQSWGSIVWLLWIASMSLGIPRVL